MSDVLKDIASKMPAWLKVASVTPRGTPTYEGWCPTAELPGWVARAATVAPRGTVARTLRGAAVTVTPGWTHPYIAEIKLFGRPVHWAPGTTPEAAWIRLRFELERASGAADLIDLRRSSMI